VLAITGGTLHDVNNLLTVVSGNLYLLTEEVRGQQKLYDRIRGARNTAERGSALMRELLTFARDPDNEPQAICPANHIVAMEPLLRRGIDEQHCFEIKHSDEPWSVAASAAQLESAVVNLVINAHDALSARGTVSVRIDNINIGDERAQQLGMQRGDYVCIRIADDGVGIPAAQLSRVTEPLYTSKPAGHGSGLGLAMVQRFTAACGGTLRIRSVEHRGTFVEMWLPRCKSQAEVTANMTLPLSTLPSGNESVLLVNQNAEVRAAVQQILEALGYSVVSTGAHDAAVELVDTLTELSIVVCERSTDDLQTMNQWLDSVRKIKPDIRQLAVLEPGVSAADAAPDADAYLHRPIAIFDLAHSMRAALEA
jgi:CheY-like chemotaxis protein/anti-sigma regulatory factor (Ser/Thr protein kinase)